jgi:hypothetical protein
MHRAGTVILFVLSFLAFAAVADAQCLSCLQGHCTVEVDYGQWCSRSCCSAEFGASCPAPDFFDLCGGFAAGSFQFVMFTDGLPRPQMIPNCRMRGLLQQQGGAVPRLTGIRIQARQSV